LKIYISYSELLFDPEISVRKNPGNNTGINSLMIARMALVRSYS